MHCNVTPIVRQPPARIGQTLLLVGALWLVAATGRGADESLEARRERLNQLPPAQAAEVLEKKRRFEELQPEQQQQLRSLHEQIEHDAEGERLRRVLARYTDWLKTLPSGQRAELLSLSADQRVDQIKKVMEQQREQQNRRFLGKPPAESDLKVILDWFEAFIERNQERLLAELPPARREQVREVKDPKHRPFALYFTHMREHPGEDAIVPTEEDIQLLKPQLSPETWKVLEQAPAANRAVLLQQWSGAAIFTRRLGSVTDEELSRYYKEDLDANKREWLDSLPREAARRELRRLYFMDHWKKTGDGSRPSFPARPFSR